jgi:hypothetical protein
MWLSPGLAVAVRWGAGLGCWPAVQAVHSLGQGSNQAVFGGDAGRAVRIDLKTVG